MSDECEEKMFYLRVRQIDKEYLVSACDQKLLGETIEDGEVELFVSDRFFGGELVTLDKCLREIVKATNCNLIGEAISNAVIEEELVNEIAVKWIDCKKNGRVGHIMIIR